MDDTLAIGVHKFIIPSKPKTAENLLLYNKIDYHTKREYVIIFAKLTNKSPYLLFDKYHSFLG